MAYENQISFLCRLGITIKKAVSHFKKTVSRFKKTGSQFKKPVSHFKMIGGAHFTHFVPENWGIRNFSKYWRS